MVIFFIKNDNLSYKKILILKIWVKKELTTTLSINEKHYLCAGFDTREKNNEKNHHAYIGNYADCHRV